MNINASKRIIEKEPYYLSVTEVAGIESSEEEIQRLANRYFWAANYCRNRDVLELSCGTAQGSGYLKRFANQFLASDYSWINLCIARAHYKKSLDLLQIDAQSLPFRDKSFDVVILLESIYFFPSAKKAVAECKRVLRKSGNLLISMPNKHLYDFSPSVHGFDYPDMQDLEVLLLPHGFLLEFFGDTPINEVSWIQRVLRPLKALAVKTHLIPQTRKGKKFLRRLVFGPLKPMPKELNGNTRAPILPQLIPKGIIDRTHKVIFCAATLQT